MQTNAGGFDHAGLIQNINEGLLPLKKAQPEALQAFGQLARAAMLDGITQHCSGCIGFHAKAWEAMAPSS